MASSCSSSISTASTLLWLLCLCAALPGTLQAAAARPPSVTIGALFTFDSVIGRTAIQLAVNADPTVLRGTNLSVVFQDIKCSGFVGTIQALELMERQVVAVVGPQSSGIAHVVSHVANQLRVLLLSFAATDLALASVQYPYFVRATHYDRFQMAAVADVVAHHSWREVTAVYVDNNYGRGGVVALEAIRARMSVGGEILQPGGRRHPPNINELRELIGGAVNGLLMRVDEHRKNTQGFRVVRAA